MKPLSLVILGTLVIVAAQAPSQTAHSNYDELFRSTWQTINDNYFDPAFHGADWQEVRRRYEPRLSSVTNDSEFLSLAYQMMGELHTSHLELSPPAPPSQSIGVRGTAIGYAWMVTQVSTASDAQRQGLRPGDLILNVKEIRGLPGSKASVNVQGCDGSKRTIEVRREETWSPPERPSIRWKRVQQAPGRAIGYIRASRFDDDAAPLIDEAMSQLGDTDALIIDVRDNSGGNISPTRLVSYFVDGRQLSVALLSRPFLTKLGSTPEQIDVKTLPQVSGAYTTRGIIEAMAKNGGGAAFYTEDVEKKRYRGKVVVLMNHGTGSAAEGFAWGMKMQTKGTIIGTKTAGALLGAERFDLLGGWVLTVPTHAGWGPDGKQYIDKPVSPDIEVQWVRDDYCAQRDPDLSKALAVLDEHLPARREAFSLAFLIGGVGEEDSTTNPP